VRGEESRTGVKNLEGDRWSNPTLKPWDLLVAAVVDRSFVTHFIIGGVGHDGFDVAGVRSNAAMTRTRLEEGNAAPEPSVSDKGGKGCTTQVRQFNTDVVDQLAVAGFHVLDGVLKGEKLIFLDIHVEAYVEASVGVEHVLEDLAQVSVGVQKRRQLQFDFSLWLRRGHRGVFNDVVEQPQSVWSSCVTLIDVVAGDGIPGLSANIAAAELWNHDRFVLD